MWKTDIASYEDALEKMRQIETEIYACKCSQFTIDEVEDGINKIERAISLLADNTIEHHHELDMLNTYGISKVLDIINPALTYEIEVLNRIVSILDSLQA